MNLLPPELAALIRAAIQAAQAAGDLPAFDVPATIPVQRSNKPELGEFASPAALQMAKLAGRKPLDIANAIASHLPASAIVAGITVAPPGFLNIQLNRGWVRDQINTITAAGDDVFTLDLGAGKRAQVECVSANPTGPLTVGHTRNGIIGSTMANILRAVGYDVELEYYFNNAGRQMRVLGQSLQARYLQTIGQAVPLPEDGYQGDYLVEVAQKLAAEYGDTLKDEPWERFKSEAEKAMFAWIETSLKQINITFDVHFNENSLYEDNSVWVTLDALKAKGHVYEAITREGASDEERAKLPADAKPALWFRSTTLGDEEDRVLVKSTGEPTYVLPDIAYHVNKIERGFDLMVNVLGADHIIEAQTVRRGLQALAYDPAGLHVILYQFVTLFEGGEMKKMSTRRGEFVTQDELVADVGADVVRYFILARSPNSHLEFDLVEARDQSNDNPVYYIQNAHVRCAGIFRQVEEQRPDLLTGDADLSLLNDRAYNFILKTLELPDVLAQAYEDFEPHKLAFYALELAREFHPMYDDLRVLHSDVPDDLARARLRLYGAAKVVFKRLLTLMGMSAPEVM